MSAVSNNRPPRKTSRGQGASRQQKRTTGGRETQNTRISASQRARNLRKRKPQYDYKMIAIIGVVLILVITGVVFATKFFKKQDLPQIATTESETQLEKKVTVDGVSVTGLSKSQAKEEILKKYDWKMSVTYEDAEAPYQVANLIEPKVDEILEEIYKGNPKETYTLDVSGMEEAASAEAATIAQKWDVPPQNGAIAGFDKDTGKFIYSGEKTGKVINQDKLVQDIQDALNSKQFQAVITAAATAVAPEITEAQAKEMYKVIGAMSTQTTANKDRNTNIQLAANALDGLIIQPGEEFSFNKTTGNRTLERGYKPAGAYVNGVLVEEPGGGVCQVSSTLYNAVVFSGLTTTERHAHSYEPNYITPGEDAMVSYDGYAGPDMKFINNTRDAVAIRARFQDRKLTISIVGIQVLEDGEKWYMKSKKVADVDPPAPVYEENQTLQPGVEKEVKKASLGSRWETNLVKEKNGSIVSDELFHKSTYKGKPATIQRNTSGVVIPDPTASQAPSEVTSESSIVPSQEPPESTPQGTNPGDIGPGVTQAPTQAPTQGPAQTQSQAPPAPSETAPAALNPSEGNIVPSPF